MTIKRKNNNYQLTRIERRKSQKKNLQNRLFKRFDKFSIGLATSKFIEFLSELMN